MLLDLLCFLVDVVSDGFKLPVMLDKDCIEYLWVGRVGASILSGCGKSYENVSLVGVGVPTDPALSLYPPLCIIRSSSFVE